MRAWSHDDLHELFEADPDLKRRSEELHAQAPAEDLASWTTAKHEMMALYCTAVGCRRASQASAFVDEVTTYIGRHCDTIQRWRELLASDERHGAQLAILIATARDRAICHAPNGNDYICRCDEAGKIDR